MRGFRHPLLTLLMAVVVLLAMGGRDLPVPCQMEQTATTACVACPASCTCRLAGQPGCAEVCGTRPVTADLPNFALPPLELPGLPANPPHLAWVAPDGGVAGLRPDVAFARSTLLFRPPRASGATRLG